MDADIAWEECIGDLPLDTTNLPPLNALSSTSSTELPQLDMLDLFSFEAPDPHPDTPHTPEKLPLPDTFTPVTSPDLSPDSLSDTAPESLSHCTANSNSSIASHPPPKPHPPSHTSATHDEQALPRPAPVSDSERELSTRLASASAENTALRKRLAAVTAENRSLRAALDHANARLVAVAQAASAQPPVTSPVMLGLAQVSTDVANRIAGALTVSDTSDDSPRDRKKRKRVTGAAATTMACVMFMWGAFVGTPGLLKGGNSAYRSEGNLPAVWKGDGPGAVAPVGVNRVMHDSGRGWQPNCMRVLKELPDGSESDSDKEVDTDKMVVDDVDETKEDAAEKMFVNMGDKAAANVVAKADSRDPDLMDYSYVLCRNAKSAIDNVKACSTRMKRGEPCGEPHTIALILPAAAAGMDDENDTNSLQPALAEVQCSITSVARIPVESGSGNGASKYGRIIATVKETGTVIRE